MFAELFAAVEASALGQAARGSVWLYPLANLLHVLGAALVVGSIAVFDLLVLARRYPDAVGSGRVAIPLAAAGLAVQVLTGIVLFSAEATTIGRNPAFLFKMALLAIGLVNVIGYHMLHRIPAEAEAGHGGAARLHALVSLLTWVFVLLAGRAIAYV
jgi:hypothetical protein